ncbi:hypothetical protein N7448_005998 [Penicillium atrosanguineum]|uniref:Uncharacterized protein n=1 Tax=Penicillium atrosanguineum TaxID=1132637 RepID=A0A9W9PQU8_9EURO|nr:hypothetical protein N7448_005998 [Penicillium atrosanguineum]KAJ5137954.1 hypothetical protein N7526_004187 [Penicillium atrosanguineum]KAJ5307322.1 hypothetical protein N7476_007978 [Penicillium atrosanguineum]
MTVNPFSLQALIWALPTPNKKDQSGRNWLSWAAEYHDDEIVLYCLQVKDKVDINICDGTEDSFSKTPLIWALEGRNERMITMLKDGDTSSLHLLVEGISSIEQKKILDLVTRLVQADYNLNQPDQKGRTPLHLACLGGSQKLVSALIEANADLNAIDHAGEIPLQYALRARNKAVVDLLLNALSTDLKPVQSQQWFNLGDKSLLWIQITRRAQSQGFELELINDRECDWLPDAKEARLCICEERSIWSRLPEVFDVHVMLSNKSCYWNYAQRDFGHRSVNYISLIFPCEQGKDNGPWGIAWIKRRTVEGFAQGFISMLPSGWVPNDPSDFFNLFLEALHQKWKASCFDANERIELLRHDQVKKCGRSRGLVDELAKNALQRADLRRCLQSHIEGLNEVVTTNLSLEPDPQLKELIHGIDQEVSVKLDKMEQAVRDLLQIVRKLTENLLPGTKINRTGACMGFHKRGGKF